MNEKEQLTKIRSEIDNQLLGTELQKAVKVFFEFFDKFIRHTTDVINSRLSQVKNGVDGKSGRDGVNGKDGKNGADGKSIEGPQGPEGTPGINGSPDTADDIRNKLELINEEDEKLKISAISHLREELDALAARIGKAGTGGTAFAISRGAIKLYDLSDKLDGVTKTFSLPSFWRVLTVQSTSTPNVFRPTTDYTTDGSAMTITFTSAIDAPSTLAGGQTLTVLYAEP